MGIDALGRVIKINPEFAEEHQLAVIDCLEVRLRPFFGVFHCFLCLLHMVVLSV